MSIVPKSNLQTVNFAIIFVTINGLTCTFFRIILNDIRTEVNEQIHEAYHNYSHQTFIMILFKLKG